MEMLLLFSVWDGTVLHCISFFFSQYPIMCMLRGPTQDPRESSAT